MQQAVFWGNRNTSSNKFSLQDPYLILHAIILNK